MDTNTFYRHINTEQIPMFFISLVPQLYDKVKNDPEAFVKNNGEQVIIGYSSAISALAKGVYKDTELYYDILEISEMGDPDGYYLFVRVNRI